MKYLVSLALALLVAFSPAPLSAQGLPITHGNELAASGIKKLEKKIDLCRHQIELHEQCLHCETCECTVSRKKGKELHRHVAKLKFDKKTLSVKHVAPMGARPTCDPATHYSPSDSSAQHMEARVRAEIIKLQEEIASCEHRIAQLQRTMEAMGKDPY